MNSYISYIYSYISINKHKIHSLMVIRDKADIKFAGYPVFENAKRGKLRGKKHKF